MNNIFWDKIKIICNELQVEDYLLRKWRSRGKVPANRHFQFMEVSGRLQLCLTYQALHSSFLADESLEQFECDKNALGSHRECLREISPLDQQGVQA